MKNVQQLFRRALGVVENKMRWKIQPKTTRKASNNETSLMTQTVSSEMKISKKSKWKYLYDDDVLELSENIKSESKILLMRSSGDD